MGFQEVQPAERKSKTILTAIQIEQVKDFLRLFIKVKMTIAVRNFFVLQFQCFVAFFYFHQAHILEATVAIKCIDMKGVKDSISRQMLQCEIQALKTLKHSNILDCYDVVKEISHCYIITEFCNQGDLGAILKKKRRFSETQAMKIIKDIVSGYIQIGEKSFLHRDLKLANIFMSSGNAKIADFGFAKKNKYTSQRQKYNVGSPLYMSPQALKKNIYSQKNDIWSIGIMAYELVHGQTPWQCRTEKELMDKMVRIPVKFRQTLNLSHDLKTFIKKCLQVDEKKRMSLDQLKKWIQNPSDITYQNKQRSTMPPKLNLTHKPNSAIQTLSSKPLTQLTNRITNRTQRVNSVSQNHSNKQNNDRSSSKILPKAILQRNNTIVVNEINSYRLLYKILEKVKKYHSNETDLINYLGNQVIRRATSLKNCCIDNMNKSTFDLKEMDSYLSQSSNPSIKKYKSVISEYFKKYTAQITVNTVNKYERLVDILKGFLKKQNLPINSSQQLVMYYWMVEFVSLPNQFKKQHLDGIIQPKIKLNKEYILQRIKESC